MINKNQQPAPVSDSLDIHTMPQRFMKTDDSGKKAKIIGLTIIITVLTAVLASAAFYLNYVLKKPVAEPRETVNANGAIKTNLNVNRPVNNAAGQNINSPAGGQNQNANFNVNANLNADTNVNLNLNIGPLALPDSPDLDNDGLTDEEEKIYGTGVGKPDTDGDSYLDGSEVLNGYNPLGGGKLNVSDLADVFVSPFYDYSIVYPVDWTVEVVESGGQEAMFVSSTGEFVQVLVQDNPGRLTAKEWYLEQWPDLTASQLKPITVNGLAGVWDLEGLTVYLAKNDKLYVIAYSIGNKSEMNFRTTFEMMVDSFELK